MKDCVDKLNLEVLKH